MFWYILYFFIFIIIIYCSYYMIKFANPYKLIMVFGKKGAGKSTYMAKLVQQYNKKKGWTCFSDSPIPGAYLIETTDIGKVQFPEKSLIIVDEAGILFNNREWKNFSGAQRQYFKLQRHYKHRVILCSQSWDVDLTLRLLADHLELLINYFNVLTVSKQIKRKIVVTEATGDQESRIADQLVISPFIMTPFGARHFIWIPKYAKLFNSYAAPELDTKFYYKVEYPEKTPVKFMSKLKLPKLKRIKNAKSKGTSQGVSETSVTDEVGNKDE